MPTNRGIQVIAGIDGQPRPCVFVSYARSDIAVARRIVLLLHLLPIEIYWDQHLRAGDAVEASLEHALSRATCVVVLWSAASAGSKWVQIEAADADDRNIIIPVRLDSATLPLRHRHRQYIDFKDWAGDPADQKALDLRRAVSAMIYGAATQPVHMDRSDIAAELRNQPGRRGLNLAGADLTDLDLHDAQLIGANLVRADLSRVDLRGANLSGANLEDANLTRAKVGGASFRRANLWLTNLTETSGLLTADLAETNFFRNPGFDPAPVAGFTGAKVLNFADYSSFLAYYVQSVGLTAAQLFDTFPWLAHREFTELLSY